MRPSTRRPPRPHRSPTGVVRRHAPPPARGQGARRSLAFLALVALLFAGLATSPATVAAAPSPTDVGDLFDVSSHGGGQITGMDLADLTGDGVPEVLLGNRDTDTVEVWSWDAATGTMVKVDGFGVAHDPHTVRAADLDGDGDQDVLVGLRFRGLYLARNDGGSWHQVHLSGAYSWWVDVADIDGDGNLDVFHGIDRSFAQVLYGDGALGFTNGPAPVNPRPGTRGLGLALVDLDGDGDADVIGNDGLVPRVFFNTSTPGSPSWSADSGPGGGYPPGYELLSYPEGRAGDLDGNGVVDHVTIVDVWPLPPTTAEVVVYEGSDVGGTLTWAPRTVASVPGPWTMVTMVDVDRDGNLDLLLSAGGFTTGMVVLHGDGAGGFVREDVAATFQLGNMNAIVQGDVDGDGDLDLVGATPPSGFALLRTPSRGTPDTPPLYDHVIGSYGFGPGQFHKAAALGVTDDGTLFAGSWHNSRLQVFDLVGGYQREWRTFEISDVQVDGNGDLWVVEHNRHRVTVFDQAGATLHHIFGLTYPSGLALDEDSGHVWVTDRTHRVLQFNTDGTPVAAWGGLGTADGQFTNPQDVDLGPEGLLYVADTTNNRVQVFEPDGTFVRSFGTLGSAPGQLNGPGGLFFDAAGDLFVSEHPGNRVQKLTRFGGQLAVWGAQGGAAFQFNAPGSMALGPNGALYVSDHFNHRVHRFAWSADPVLEAGPAQTAVTGVPATIGSGGFTDADTPDGHGGVIDWGDGTVTPATITVAGGVGAIQGTHTYAEAGTYTVRETVWDGLGGTAVDTFTMTVGQAPPTVAADNPSVTVDEGTPAANTGTFGGTGVTVTASVGTVTQDTSTWSWSLPTTDGPDESQTVTVTATDDEGTTATTAFDLVVDNVAPTVTADEAIVDAAGDTPVTTTGTYGDAGDDTVTVTASVGTLTQDAGTWTWTHTLVEPATVTITATDDDGASAATTFDVTVTWYCHGLEATIVGTDAGEVLRGTDGPDVIVARGGDDVILGLGGDDVACGGAGNDTIVLGDGDDVGHGGPGTDHVTGGSGNDLLLGGDDADVLVGDAGEDTAFGGGGGDLLLGGNHADVLHGGDGDDRIGGHNGDDVLHGDDGDDTVDGHNGDDEIHGGDGDDQLDGHNGDDEIRGDAGNDVLRGGPGDDVLDAGPGDDTVDGGPGRDTCLSAGPTRRCEV